MINLVYKVKIEVFFRLDFDYFSVRRVGQYGIKIIHI